MKDLQSIYTEKEDLTEQPKLPFTKAFIKREAKNLVVKARQTDRHQTYRTGCASGAAKKPSSEHFVIVRAKIWKVLGVGWGGGWGRLQNHITDFENSVKDLCKIMFTVCVVNK